MSLLIRPSLLQRAPFTSEYVCAAVFLDVTSTIESFTEELSVQLRDRLDRFAQVADQVRRAWNRSTHPIVLEQAQEPLAEVGSPAFFRLPGDPVWRRFSTGVCLLGRHSLPLLQSS